MSEGSRLIGKQDIHGRIRTAVIGGTTEVCTGLRQDTLEGVRRLETIHMTDGQPWRYPFGGFECDLLHHGAQLPHF